MKITKDFIDNTYREEILNWIVSREFNSVGHTKVTSKEISKEIEGFTALYDFNHSSLSQFIASFHGEYIDEAAPQILIDLNNKIADLLKLNKEHSYVQVIVLNKGKIIPHYDASVKGYVNYKCNVVIDGPTDDTIYVGKTQNKVNLCDLYHFEASLYKHWADYSDHRRLVLSFGYLVTCSSLGWDENAPRVKLSNRIMSKLAK